VTFIVSAFPVFYLLIAVLILPHFPLLFHVPQRIAHCRPTAGKINSPPTSVVFSDLAIHQRYVSYCVLCRAISVLQFFFFFSLINTRAARVSCAPSSILRALYDPNPHCVAPWFTVHVAVKAATH